MSGNNFAVNNESKQNQPQLKEWKFTNLQEMLKLLAPIELIFKQYKIPYAFAGSVGAILDPTIDFGRSPRDVDILVPFEMIDLINRVLANYLERPLRPDTPEEASGTKYASGAYGHLILTDPATGEKFICDIVANCGMWAYGETGREVIFLSGINELGQVLAPFTAKPSGAIPTTSVLVGGLPQDVGYIPAEFLKNKYIMDPNKDSEDAKRATKPKKTPAMQKAIEDVMRRRTL